MQKQILILSLLLAGCTSSSGSPSEPVPDFDIDSSRTEESAAEQGPHVSFRAGYQQMSEDLINIAVEKQSGNFVFSPFSVYSALGLVYEGSSGDMRSQMSGVFGFSPNDEKRRNELQKLFGQINDSGSVEIANSFWVNKNSKIDIKKDFREVLERFYGAKITETAFGESGRNRINSWVRIKTGGMIDNLLKELSEDETLVLVNALYFQEDWQNGFDTGLTKQGEFHHNPPYWLYQQFMHNPAMPGVNYAEDESWQVLGLPYQNDQYELQIFLPQGQQRREMDFAKENLNSWEDKMTPQTIAVTLPKFETEWRFPALKETLIEMGMSDVFDAHLADFSNIAKDPIYITQVEHQSAIKLDEKGTEAAAATAVVATTRSMNKSPEAKSFNANHPFWFVLKDKENDLVVFVGQYVGSKK